MMPQGKPIYSFPELRPMEILQCMEDLRIALSEADLAKPTPNTVQRVFEAFVDIFMGMPREQVANGVGLLEMVEYPELHVDAIQLVAFYRSVLKLMQEVGVDDFGLRDIIRPEPHRFKLILSAVINFAKFREEQLAVFEELNRRSEEIIERRAQLSQRRHELTHTLQSIEEQRAAEEPNANALREEIASLIHDLRELKREQTNLSAEIEQMKQRRQEQSEKLAQAQFLHDNLRQECNKLKSRIVHSPERLLQEKANLMGLERKGRELQSKLESLSLLEQEMIRTMGTLETLEEALKRRDEVTLKLRDTQEGRDRQQSQLEDLSHRQSQVHRQLSAAQDKTSRLLQQQEQRRQALTTQLSQLEQEYSLLCQERQQALLKIEQADRLVKDFEMRMQEVKKSHEQEMIALRSDCVSLKQQVVQYIGEVKKHL